MIEIDFISTSCYSYKFVDFNIYRLCNVVKISNTKNRVYLMKEKYDSQIISIMFSGYVGVLNFVPCLAL